MALGWHLDGVKQPRRDIPVGEGSDIVAVQTDWSRARNRYEDHLGKCWGSPGERSHRGQCSPGNENLDSLPDVSVRSLTLDTLRL